MDLIISFNNKGAHYCQEFDFDNAFACFRNAAMGLSLLKEKSDWSDVCHDHTECLKQKLLNKTCNPIKGWSKELKSEATQDGYSLMFSRIIFLSQNQSCDCSLPSSMYVDFVTLCVLYNMAILHHIQSDSKGPISEAIEAAYHAYKQAILISKKFETIECARFSYDFELLKLALINNLGVLYHNNFCRFKDAMRCFKSWRKHMDALEEEFILADVMTPEEILNFSMNLLVVPTAAAPSA